MRRHHQKITLCSQIAEGCDKDNCELVLMLHADSKHKCLFLYYYQSGEKYYFNIFDAINVGLLNEERLFLFFFTNKA